MDTLASVDISMLNVFRVAGMTEQQNPTSILDTTSWLYVEEKAKPVCAIAPRSRAPMMTGFLPIASLSHAPGKMPTQTVMATMDCIVPVFWMANGR